jgi:hypothetical protein
MARRIKPRRGMSRQAARTMQGRQDNEPGWSILFYIYFGVNILSQIEIYLKV